MTSVERKVGNVASTSLDAHVQGWRMRAQAEAQQQDAWRDRVRELLPALVSLLTTEFGVTRVILFGSFAAGGATPGSDIDLLVEGLGSEHLIEATAAADRLLWVERIGVDLVPTQMARAPILERAEREGERLYG